GHAHRGELRGVGRARAAPEPRPGGGDPPPAPAPPEPDRAQIWGWPVPHPDREHVGNDPHGGHQGDPSGARPPAPGPGGIEMSEVGQPEEPFARDPLAIRLQQLDDLPISQELLPRVLSGTHALKLPAWRRFRGPAVLAAALVVR